jgi:cation transport regulator ChaB
MPYTKPPEKIKALPKEAQNIWVSAFNAAYEQYNKDEAMANAVAWAAVKNKYKKENDRWVEKKTATEKSLDEIIQEMKKTAEMSYPISVSELKFAENGNTTEIQVLPKGKWSHPVYGMISIDEKDLNDFKENFEGNIRKELPITEGHSVGEEEKPAIGWFKKVINKGRDGLWAVVEWTKEGMKLIKDKSYKYFSPEFYTNYEDPETREKHKNVLVGGALTNRPYFKGLKAVVLSELILLREMTLEDILKKDVSELEDEEVAFIKENKDKLTDEQKETLKDVLKEDEEKPDEELKKEEDKDEEAEEEEEETEEEKDASEKMIVSKKALKFLETQAQEGVKAMEKWRTSEAKGYVQGLTFSETNPKGKILPKSQDKVVNFLLSLSDKQQKAFKEIMGEMPKANLFSEVGEGSGIPVKTSERINDLVKNKMSENKDLGYRQALEQVFSENPELQKEYSEE